MSKGGGLEIKRQGVVEDPCRPGGCDCPPFGVWSIDKIGKAVFYYQRELNERFTRVVT